MWDCQLFDGSYQNNNYCPYGTSYYDAASNVGYTARALLRPDISILTNGGTYLRQAYFALYATGSDNNATHIHDLCAGGTFWGNGPNTTWANTAGGAPRGDQCVSFDATPNTYYRGVDVTPATRAALANQFPYYGFVLKNDNETCRRAAPLLLRHQLRAAAQRPAERHRQHQQRGDLHGLLGHPRG